ncbi:MAG: Asp-tRNA(Asn)/Glu-tRNA(Gln) amidotransferase subunit GatA [Fibrobacter sp.]|nr:Asp-tRNA(Asn)/Glu-tRNA(Gln) amidotransferase subunit GatA [Fibrobacter sp.]
MSIDELQAKLNAGASAVSLAEEALLKIESTKNLNAYISVLSDYALEKAKESDKRRAEGKSLGALDGIPVAIKDNMCLTGTRTTAASKILENFVAPYTATAVEKLEAAGAVIVGKTNMDEFAMGSSNETSYFGPVKNPLDESRVPGGSSGGSAVAVASGTVACALGSDTGGSIRQPAACTGVVGLKPTYGRVSRYGLLAYASSLDQIGPFGATVKDCATLLSAICGIDPHDNTTSTRPTEDFASLLNAGVMGKIVGVPKEYFAEGLDAECKAAIESMLKKLEAEGAILKDISLPHIGHAVSSYYIIATAEASSNLSRYDGVRYGYRSKDARKLLDLYSMSRSEGFGKEVQRRILLGSYVLSAGFYDAYYVQAQKVRKLITDDFNKAFESCDVIASPTMPGLPLKCGMNESDPMAVYLSDIYTVSLNLAGLPGISVPCGMAGGLPVGLQWIGKPFDEANLLAVAQATEMLNK